MANNYCEFSEAFKLPEAAANDFIAIVDAGERLHLYRGCQWS